MLAQVYCITAPRILFSSGVGHNGIFCEVQIAEVEGATFSLPFKVSADKETSQELAGVIAAPWGFGQHGTATGLCHSYSC